MNKYLKNLCKIEFVVTYACTGKCKHCSEGTHKTSGEKIDPTIAAETVRKVAKEYDIKTVMAFGGEPLLCTDAVYAIINAARELNIPRRQVITNGYFSRDTKKICEVVNKLSMCGVNDLLLSVDAFHQETIPLEVVKEFALEAKRNGIPTRLQPAWLVTPDAKNPYNEKTHEILRSLSDTELPVGNGNIIFPEGNALLYFAEYFTDNRPENPYADDPSDIRCLSFSPNGDVLDGNIYREDIMDIIKNYEPK